MNPEQTAFQVFNSAGFAMGNESARIISDEEISWSLYSSLGQLLISESSKSGIAEVSQAIWHQESMYSKLNLLNRGQPSSWYEIEPIRPPNFHLDAG